MSTAALEVLLEGLGAVGFALHLDEGVEYVRLEVLRILPQVGDLVVDRGFEGALVEETAPELGDCNVDVEDFHVGEGNTVVFVGNA